MISARRFQLYGAIGGFLAVALGAFGAHVLEARLDAHHLDIWQKAVNYQGLHSLALLAVALLARNDAGRHLLWAGRGFTTGMILFSGSLYLLAITGTKWLGAITPLGGGAFLAGWAALAIHAWQHRDS